MKPETSESINELAAALSKAQSKIQTAIKDARADAGNFSYQYATLDNIWETIRETLTANDLSVSQIPFSHEGQFHLETILMHSSGQFVRGTMTLPVSPGRMSELQAMGSAITYARRYMLSAMVGVTIGEDDDGQLAKTLENQENKPIMTPEKLLIRLNREESIRGFYSKPEEILELFDQFSFWPDSNDMDSWKLIFMEAKDYAVINSETNENS